MSDEFMPSLKEVVEKPIIEGSAQDTKNISNSVDVKPLPSLGIKVKALRAGFFNGARKEEGDEFMVPKEQMLGSWMECVDFEQRKKHEKMMAKKKEEHRKAIAGKGVSLF